MLTRAIDEEGAGDPERDEGVDRLVDGLTREVGLDDVADRFQARPTVQGDRARRGRRRVRGGISPHFPFHPACSGAGHR